MYIGRVAGTVVATVKHEAFHGHKLLLVDRLDLAGQPTAEYDICVDMARAGVGDRVLVLDEGNGARQVLNRPGRAGAGGDCGDRGRRLSDGRATKPAAGGVVFGCSGAGW